MDDSPRRGKQCEGNGTDEDMPDDADDDDDATADEAFEDDEEQSDVVESVDIEETEDKQGMASFSEGKVEEDEDEDGQEDCAAGTEPDGADSAMGWKGNSSGLFIAQLQPARQLRAAAAWASAAGGRGWFDSCGRAEY